MEQKFRGLIYGLGSSINEDIYIEEYRSLALEYGPSSGGKLINLNLIGAGAAALSISNGLMSLGISASQQSSYGEALSSASTNLSSSTSSINSLNGMQAPSSMVINQQHYLLLQ